MNTNRFSPITLCLTVLVAILTILFVRQTVRSEGAEGTRGSAPPAAITFNYQGQLLGRDGVAVNESAVPITFDLYDTATVGTSCWTEAHTVAVSNGIFSALLGSVTAIPDDCITGDIYLEVTVDGETLTPRELLNNTAQTLPDDATLRGDIVFNSDTDVNDAKDAVIRIQADNPDKWLGIDQNEVVAYGQALNLQTSNATGDVYIGTNVEIRGTGQSIFTNPQDVKAETGGAALRFGEGDIWMGIDNNEILVMGAPLALQHNGNTDVIVHTNLEVKGDSSVAGNGYFEQGVTSAGNIVYGGSGSGMNIMPAQDENLYIKTQGADGAVHVGGNGGSVDLYVTGNLSIGGSCSAANLHSNSLAVHDASCTAGSITTGAVIEGNLQTVAERQNGGNPDFELGDLLCWSQERLQRCDEANDVSVQAVSDATGNPIILGAEWIKVTGSVRENDFLVTSDILGHAIATNTPTFGIVIAQALQNFDGEHGKSGLILAMIDKK